jgi:biopolymer transport protein ExbB
MYPLLLCSLFAVSISLERLWFWWRETRQLPLRRVRGYLNASRNRGELPFTEVLPDCEFTTRLRNATQGTLPGAVPALLRGESERAYERANRYLIGLDTVVSISPLLGILGTVLGIMRAFHALDAYHQVSPSQISHGLAEAMITTAAGLVIAVPSLVAFNIFQSLGAQRAAKLWRLAEDQEVGDGGGADDRGE